MKQDWCTKANADEDECGNWMCECGHLRQSHYFSWNNLKEKDYKKYVCRVGCDCIRFRFVNNDLCEIECLFRKKLEDVEGKWNLKN